MDDHQYTPTNDRTEWEEEEGGLGSARYVVEPSPGTHVIFWRGNWIRLDRVREQQQVRRRLKDIHIFNTIIIKTPYETINKVDHSKICYQIL